MGRTTRKFEDKIESLDVIYFAVVAHIMMHFATIYKKNKKSKDIPQVMLVSRYVACVAKEITDVTKQYNLLRGDQDEAIKELKVGNGGDSSKISRIMTGYGLFDMKEDFIDVGENVRDRRNDRKSPVEVFTDLLENVFEEKRLLMLSLIYIIVNDKYIRNNEASFELFRKCIYKEDGEYIFADFMVGVLLYTIFNEKNEDEEKRYANSICARLFMSKCGRARYSADNSHIVKLVNKVNTNYKEILDTKEEDNKVTIKNNYIFQDLFEGWDKNKSIIDDSVLQHIDYKEVELKDTQLMAERLKQRRERIIANFEDSKKLTEELENACLNSPDGYDICYFCKKYIALNEHSEKEGFCSYQHSIVRIDCPKCEHYKQNKKKVWRFRR